MTHAEKLRCMERHLGALGVPRSLFAPPGYRAAWRMGLELPPPLFTGFLPLAAASGLAFAVLWAALVWLSMRMVHAFMPGAVLAAPMQFIAVAALAAGTVFGLVMAGVVRYRARKLGLPPWSRYTGAPGNDSEP